MTKKKAVKQNQWLRDLIPEYFVDLDTIFEDVLFNGLIFFWEQDGGGESLEHNSKPWDTEECGPFKWDNSRKECYDAMKAAYEWGKTREESRPKAPEIPAERWENVFASDEYGKACIAYENELKRWEAERDTHMLNIIKYKGHLWT